MVPSRPDQMMPHPSRDHPAAAGLQQRDRQPGTQAALGNYEFAFIRVHCWLPREQYRAGNDTARSECGRPHHMRARARLGWLIRER
jgi:hypothetical protein